MNKAPRFAVLFLAILTFVWVVLGRTVTSISPKVQPAAVPVATSFPTLNPVQSQHIPEGSFPFPDVSRSQRGTVATRVPATIAADESASSSVDAVISIEATLAVTGTPTSQPSVTPAEDPAVEALRELQVQSPDSSSGLYGGVRNSRGGSAPSFVPVTPTGSPEPTATPGLPRVGGIPTGYTMLYLMHPKARLTVERQIEAILKANLDEVYLGVLADGTFSIDFDYLDSVVRRLTADGRALTLALYFSNGSAMRNYDRTPINVGFNLIPPDAFRALIEFDNATRLQFQQMVSRAIPTFELNRSLNPRSSNIAILMLEDNLDQDSYRAMRELARAVLGDRAEIVRNACAGCFPGNDASTTDAIESHDPDAVQNLTSRDGFSLDGSGYELPGDVPNQQLSLETVRQLKSLAVSRGVRYFGLWRKQRQGLGDTLILPSNRTYEVANDAQQQSEVDLLRWGLDLLAPTSESADENG